MTAMNREVEVKMKPRATYIRTIVGIGLVIALTFAFGIACGSDTAADVAAAQDSQATVQEAVVDTAGTELNGSTSGGEADVVSVAEAAPSEATAPQDTTAKTEAAVADTGDAMDVEEKVVPFVGTVGIDPSRAPVGELTTITGSGLPAGQDVDIVWHTVTGKWNIEGDYNEEYHGRSFEDTQYAIASGTTDGQGNLEVSFVVPEDYGFNHNVTVESEGVVLNRAGFDIQPTARIEPTSGPPGTPIKLTMTGIGYDRMENSWTLMYDNKYTGLLTAVTTAGTAEAIIPAVGGLGTHVLKILHGAYQFPYLNTEQNPRPDQPVMSMEFTITDGEVVLPEPVTKQGLPVVEGVEAAAGDSPVLWLDVASGPIEIDTAVRGKGFTPGDEVSFGWFSVVGNRISGSGWDEFANVLGMATVAEDGSVALPFVVPDDLGGPHRIEAIVNERSVAVTDYLLTPSARPVTPASGPAGTELTVTIKGVGWTETANIYHLVYDNAYLGYACGFNSQGDVTVYLPLAGAPGWHFIDMYPGIYKGKEAKGVQNFRVPQLTYAQDHPGEVLPAFRFAVLVTEGGIALVR